MKYISLIYIMLFVACKVTASKQIEESGMKASLSPYTMLFVGELKKRIPVRDIPCSFIPDSAFMKKYGLNLNEKGVCIVDGIVTVKEGTNVSDLKINELSVSHLYQNKYYCRLPLCKLFMLLNNSEVIYFDLSKPVLKL